MELCNFKLIRVEGHSALDWVYVAEVDVITITGFWFRKKIKTECKEIRRKYMGHWRFSDTGEFTPSYQAENLAFAWTAKTGQAC